MKLIRIFFFILIGMRIRKITESLREYPKCQTAIVIKHFKRNCDQRGETEIKTVIRKKLMKMYVCFKQKKI